MNHFYFDIPGWFGFHDVYDRAVALLGKDGAHFVEVGSWEGRSAAYMGVNIANSRKSIQFDCVDTWEGSAEHQNDPDIEGMFVRFCEKMEVFSGIVDIRARCMKSVDAAAKYDNQSLDFVFLDASHDAESVYNDIAAWRPKVKPDGVLAGDDVAWQGVREALLRHGIGTEKTPVIPSGGTYKSWILAPEASRAAWITRFPEEADNSLVEGSLEMAVETVKENLPPDAPPGCIAGHEEEFKERMGIS